MAIQNIHRHFLDIIKADQKSTDELADMYVHEMEFPEEQATDVIYNSTVKTLKKAGVFSTRRPNKRNTSKTVKMSAFELSQEDAADYKETLEDLASFAYKKIFNQKNIEKIYSKHFKFNIKMNKEGFIQFPEGVYGNRSSLDKSRRARHEAQKELASEGVKLVLKNFIPEFKETVKNKGRFYTGSLQDSDQSKIDKMSEMSSNKSEVQTRAIDSHSIKGHDTTTAILNVLDNLLNADTKIAAEVAKVVDRNNVVETTQKRMFEIFDEFEIENEKITDIVRDKAQGKEVKDKLIVKLQYGTDKLNRTMTSKDRDGISKKLDNIAQKQLEILAKSNLDKRTKRYRDLKGSKSFDKRLEDGALNVTIDMVEGVERISKLLKGVKVTSGKKVNAKKKETSKKRSTGSIHKRKRNIKNKKTARGVGVKEGIAATGVYNPRTTASDTSLGNLMQIIQKSLPRMLKRNMEPPALQYRGIGNPRQGTGPFNTGVRITSVKNNKKIPGGINVNYTYEKYPYQTFEPGFKQGNVLRDPRKLIQESIRDIMIERKQTRFLNFRRY